MEYAYDRSSFAMVPLSGLQLLVESIVEKNAGLCKSMA